MLVFRNVKAKITKIYHEFCIRLFNKVYLKYIKNKYIYKNFLPIFGYLEIIIIYNKNVSVM